MAQVVKKSACNVGGPDSTPELGRSPGEGNGNPLQYSHLEIPWTEQSDKLQSMGLQRGAHEQLTHTHIISKDIY